MFRRLWLYRHESDDFQTNVKRLRVVASKLLKAAEEDDIDLIEHFSHLFARVGRVSIPTDFLTVTNQHGETPLFIAAKKGNDKILKILMRIAIAYDLEEYDFRCNTAVWPGFTPVMIAAYNGHASIVRDLLDYKINDKSLNVRINCETSTLATALHFAAQHDHLAVVNELLLRNDNVNKRRRDGCTPLFLAAENGHLAIIEALLAKGADANIPLVLESGEIVTPLQVALNQHKFQVVQRLLAVPGINLDSILKNSDVKTKDAIQFLLTGIFKINDPLQRQSALQDAAGKGPQGESEPIFKLFKLSAALSDDDKNQIFSKINNELSKVVLSLNKSAASKGTNVNLDDEHRPHDEKRHGQGL